MIGRPEESEAAPYYFTYINQVSGENGIAIVEGQLDESLAFFSDISEERSRQRYAAGKWSIRQVLNHVSDTERAFAFRALWFARGFQTPLPSYEPDLAAGEAQADNFSWATHIEEFRRVRLATISLFRNLPGDAWRRRGVAGDKPFTVRALAFIIAGHLKHHVQVIQDWYLQL